MASFEQSRNTETGSTTSHTVLLPNNSNVTGKRLLLFANIENDGNQNPITWPSGWTQGGQLNGGTSSQRAGWAYRVVDGTEGYDGSDDSVTVTSGGASGNGSFIVARFDDTLTIDSYAQEWAASGSTTVAFDERDMGSVTTYCWLAFTVWQFSRTTSGWPQANYTAISEFQGGTGNNSSLSVAYREHEAQAEQPPSFTLSSTTAWRTWTIGAPLTTGAPPQAAIGRSTVIDLENKLVTVTQGR